MQAIYLQNININNLIYQTLSNLDNTLNYCQPTSILYKYLKIRIIFDQTKICFTPDMQHKLLLDIVRKIICTLKKRHKSKLQKYLPRYLKFILITSSYFGFNLLLIVWHELG